MAVINSILAAVKSGVDTLALTVNGTGVSSFIRKLPKREASVDPATGIYISAAERQPPVKPWGYGGRFCHEFVIEITLLSPNNDDQSANLTDYGNFKALVSNAFLLPSSIGVSGVLDTRINENPFLPRALIREGYDYVQLLLNVRVVTTAT